MAAIEVQFGRVLDVEHYLVLAHTLQTTGPVGLKQGLPVRTRIAQEAVGSLRLGPTKTGIGNALGRFAGEALGQQHCARVQALIAKLQGLEFVLCPAYGRPA